jgi:hypothetical protein
MYLLGAVLGIYLYTKAFSIVNAKRDAPVQLIFGLTLVGLFSWASVLYFGGIIVKKRFFSK